MDKCEFDEYKFMKMTFRFWMDVFSESNHMRLIERDTRKDILININLEHTPKHKYTFIGIMLYDIMHVYKFLAYKNNTSFQSTQIEYAECIIYD